MKDEAKINGEDWERVLEFLPEGWEGQARELGALKFGRSFSGAESLLRTLLMYFVNDCSMLETAEKARLGGVVNISDVGLLKRINKSGEWLRWITERLIEEEESVVMQCGPLKGRRVLAVDSSVVKEPGAVGKLWRLHYSMNIRSLRCEEVEVSSAKVGESLKQFNVRVGDILISDRGFGKRPGIRSVVERGGDIVSRINANNVPLQDEGGGHFDQLSYLRSLGVGQSGEFPAILEGKDGPIKVRVCAYRKTEQQRLESERKQGQDCQRRQTSVKAQTKELAGYVVLVTTLRDLSAEQILALYQHRWQVELAFKRMKSLLNLSGLKKKDPQGAKAWLQGKLLVACLVEKLIAVGERFSPEEEQAYGAPPHRARFSLA
jgi:hypothetical protein